MNKKTRNYLITGGAGFLGYHLTKAILRNSHPYEGGDRGGHRKKNKNSLKNKVTVLDIADQPDDNIYSQTAYIRGDVRDKKAVSKAVKGVDIIIHAAAALPLSSPSEITTTTINGTKNVLEAALRYPPPAKGGLGGVTFKSTNRSIKQRHNATKHPRVIYISSTAVYGVPEKHPILETDPLVGVGPYGHAKIAAEKLCGQYRDKGHIVPIVRPKTFIGTERLGVFQILCNWVREGRRIPVIGNGQNKYQLLDVDDLVSAILLLATTAHSSPYQGEARRGHLKKPKNSSKNQKIYPEPVEGLKTKNLKTVNSTFNVGAEHFSTVRADLTALCAHAKSGARILPIPAWLVKPALRTLEAVHLSPLYRWVYDTADKDSYVSVKKLKKLGWKPKYSNSQALIRMYDWYLKHYHQFETGPSGTTHRVGWNQGVLGLIKKFL